ncbi:holo-ACP synthase [Microbacterium sp. Sa1CUA4]|uniref:Holo-[acyl-carrier-protein] synthase n=1 Tax=Microbacterium gallinarum TaxID=2762209 RepID=A0ABR8X334_9MICO|nr:holo-ACP synthase [Microbacterium gallinarum]
MIVGIGVDLVDIARFERTLERTPRLLERLFSATERELKPRSLAARYAAKEALIKALGGSDGVHWTEIEITPEASGRPWFTLSGTTADAVADRGITTLHLSMSHDAGFATAYVVAEASAPPSPFVSSASTARQHVRDETASDPGRLVADSSSRGAGGGGERRGDEEGAQ